MEDSKEETKQIKDPYIWNDKIKIKTKNGTYEKEEEDVEIIRYVKKKVR